MNTMINEKPLLDKLKERFVGLENEMTDLNKKLQHMTIEYSETRAGSAYGVEYYEIQIKVYQEMFRGVKKELLELNNRIKEMKNKP